MEYHGASIDVPAESKRLFLEAHFLNNPYWGMSPGRRNEYELELLGKKHNAKWEGLAVRSVKEIWMGEEILLNYCPEEQTPETKRLLKNRAEEKKAKSKRTRMSVA